MPRGDLARAQERRVLRHRQQQATLESSKSFYHEAKFHDLITQSVERANRRAASNEAAATQFDLQRQAAAEAVATAQQQAQERAEAERAEEERTRKEEEETIRQTKMRQAIIDASPELRALKAKISAATVAQQQQAQLRQALDAVAHEQETEIADRVESAHRRAAEAREEEMKEAKDRQDKAQANRLALQAQLQERDALKAAAREELKKERAAIESIVEQARREEAAQRNAQAQRRQDLAAEAAAMVALQKELRKRQKAAEAEEERRIQEYMRLRREKEDRLAQQRAQRQEASDGEFERARLAAEAEAARVEEEEALLDMLRAEMEVQRAQQAAAEAAARRAAQRQDLLEAQELALQLKAQRAAKEAAWEADFRQKMIERLAGEDRVASMTASARRIAVAAHLREAERCVAYKNKLAAAMRDEEALQAAHIAVKEAARQEIVEEERLRLLQEAAAAGALGASVPRGMLQRPEDLEKLLISEKKEG